MFFRRCTQLVVESVVPYSLHVVPIRHDAVLDRVLEGQDTTLSLRLISDEMVFPWQVSVSEATCYATNRQSRGESKLHSAVKLLVHPDHDARHLRAPDDGRKDCSGSVVAREPCLPGALMGRETDSKRKTLHHGSFQGLPCTCRCHCQPQELQPRPTWLTPRLCERQSCPEAGKPKH